MKNSSNYKMDFCQKMLAENILEQKNMENKKKIGEAKMKH